MSVKKNFLYNILYQILVIILPLITTPYISRVIGAEGIGIYSYSYSVANYFVIIAMLGINNYGNRSVARVRDNKEKLDKVFSSILVFHIIISLIMVIIYIIYLLFFLKNNNKVIFLIQLIYVISALFDINWFFFGIEQFKLTVTRNTIIKLLSVFSIFIFVKEKGDLWIYALILASGSLISQCLLWPFINKFVSFKKPTFKEVLIHLKPCSILFIPVIAVSIYKIMSKIMIGSLSNMSQVGFYENSEKIINIPLGIIIALGTVMLPKMSNMKSKGLEEESEKYIDISIQFANLISIGSVFGLIGISKRVIPIFLGEEFLDCINIVSLLSITILFIAWANVIRTQYIIPNKLDRIHVISTSLGAVVNFSINLILIKKMGAIGATIGTICAEISVALYVTYKVRKNIKVKQYFIQSIPFLFSGLVMLVIIKLIDKLEYNNIFIIIFEIIIGASVYLVLNLIYIIKSKSEIGNYFSKIIKSKSLYIKKNI